MVSIFNHRFVKRPEKIAFEKQMEQQWNEMFWPEALIESAGNINEVSSKAEPTM